MNQTGKSLRDSAIARVLTPEEAWIEQYKEILRDWFESRPDGFLFTGETLTEVARARGLGEPHHHGAWGGVSMSLYAEWRSNKKMRNTGRVVPAKRPATHAHGLKEYEKIIARRYRIAQPENQMELLA